MCITPVEVEEKKAGEPGGKTEDKKKACDKTINFNLMVWWVYKVKLKSRVWAGKAQVSVFWEVTPFEYFWGR